MSKNSITNQPCSITRRNTRGHHILHQINASGLCSFSFVYVPFMHQINSPTTCKSSFRPFSNGQVIARGVSSGNSMTDFRRVLWTFTNHEKLSHMVIPSVSGYLQITQADLMAIYNNVRTRSILIILMLENIYSSFACVFACECVWIDVCVLLAFCRFWSRSAVGTFHSRHSVTKGIQIAVDPRERTNSSKMRSPVGRVGPMPSTFHRHSK